MPLIQINFISKNLFGFNSMVSLTFGGNCSVVQKEYNFVTVNDL